MRADARIFRQINEERQIEASETGCCIGRGVFVGFWENFGNFESFWGIFVSPLNKFL